MLLEEFRVVIMDRPGGEPLNWEALEGHFTPHHSFLARHLLIQDRA